MDETMGAAKQRTSEVGGPVGVKGVLEKRGTHGGIISSNSRIILGPNAARTAYVYNRRGGSSYSDVQALVSLSETMPLLTS